MGSSENPPKPAAPPRRAMTKCHALFKPNVQRSARTSSPIELDFCERTSMKEVGLVPRYRVIKVGRPISIDDLRASSGPRGRKPNPRDEELRRLVRDVNDGPEDQVIPWTLGAQKVATARLAANKVIRELGLPVYVATHRAHPGVLLFSRQPITRRGRRPA